MVRHAILPLLYLGSTRTLDPPEELDLVSPRTSLIAQHLEPKTTLPYTNLPASDLSMPHTSFLVSASHILALLDGTGGIQHSQAYFESHLLSDAAGGTTFTIVPNVARPDSEYCFRRRAFTFQCLQTKSNYPHIDYPTFHLLLQL